jgi:hypothetical protein
MIIKQYGDLLIERGAAAVNTWKNCQWLIAVSLEFLAQSTGIIFTAELCS